MHTLKAAQSAFEQGHLFFPLLPAFLYLTVCFGSLLFQFHLLFLTLFPVCRPPLPRFPAVGV